MKQVTNEHIFECALQHPNAAVAQVLSNVLADNYFLAVKTQGFHWNVTGPHFIGLHGLFEEQYQELIAAGDDIAERIRALGEVAPGSYKQFSQYASIEEEVGHPDAHAMVRQLHDDHETVIRTLSHAIDVAEKQSDQPTGDLLTERLQVHQKAVWILRSIAGEPA